MVSAKRWRVLHSTKGEIFQYLAPGEDLVLQPFTRLTAERQLVAVAYDGFWRNMDTFKDKMVLDEMVAQGNVPWQVWNRAAGSSTPGAPTERPGG